MCRAGSCTAIEALRGVIWDRSSPLAYRRYVCAVKRLIANRVLCTKKVVWRSLHDAC